MDVVRQFTIRCACGWEFRGSLDDVVDATIDHGRRIHNMEATRSEVVAALHARDEESGAERGAAGGAAPGDGTEAKAG
jgi:predicted small metal-binding protein